MVKKILTSSFSPSLKPPPQFNFMQNNIINMLTTEMYPKYKEEEEISPHKYV